MLIYRTIDDTTGQREEVVNCEHCGKEMYNTPVDGWFHKREQDAIDCYRQLWRKRNCKTEEEPSGPLKRAE